MQCCLQKANTGELLNFLFKNWWTIPVPSFFQPFWFYRADWQTDRITEADQRYTHATAVGVNKIAGASTFGGLVPSANFAYAWKACIRLVTSLASQSTLSARCYSSHMIYWLLLYHLTVLRLTTDFAKRSFSYGTHVTWDSALRFDWNSLFLILVVILPDWLLQRVRSFAWGAALSIFIMPRPL